MNKGFAFQWFRNQSCRNSRRGNKLCNEVEPIKDEAQTALFKDPVRTAL